LDFDVDFLGRSPMLCRLSQGLAALFLLLTSLSIVAQTLPAVGLIVPAYFDPSTDATDWNRMASAATQVPLIAVMNPNSGPGSAPDPSYTAAIMTLDGSGGSTLGYVHTSYGYRKLSAVKQEIARYFSWYPIDGIFVDEMATSATQANLRYYTAIKNYIRQLYPQAIIVANPGTSFDAAFAQAGVADVFIDEEDSQSNVNATPQAAWTQSYPAALFAEIAVQSSGDAQEVTLLSSRNLAWVYSTTLPLNPNPYAALPSDFDQEVAALVTVNASR
jgi:hypothetical protein